MTVVIKSGADGVDKTVKLGKADFVGFAGQNILAGATRVFEIVWPAALSDRILQSVTIAYREQAS